LMSTRLSFPTKTLDVDVNHTLFYRYSKSVLSKYFTQVTFAHNEYTYLGSRSC